MAVVPPSTLMRPVSAMPTKVYAPDVPHRTVRLRVFVYTGASEDKPLDCEVYVRLYGSARASDTIKLRNQAVETGVLFRRGSRDEFVVDCPALGALQKMSIWHDEKGHSRSWFLSKVVVVMEDGDRKSQFLFTCNDWLSSYHGDRAVRRELVAKAM